MRITRASACCSKRKPGTDARDLQIVSDICCRTALNFKTRLEFSLTSETPVAELARRILVKPARPLPLPGRLPATRVSPLPRPPG
jgi:hypothetical protein